MKKLIYAIIISIFLLFAPTIPYNNRVQEGVIIVEHKTVAKWLMDKYLGVRK